MKVSLLLFFFVSLVLKSQVVSGDYYVSVDGDDNNPGTFHMPWGTWQKAFSTAQAGDTVYFRGGIWKPTTVFLFCFLQIEYQPIGIGKGMSKIGNDIYFNVSKNCRAVITGSLEALKPFKFLVMMSS